MDRPNGPAPALVRPIVPAADALSRWLGFQALRLACGVFHEGRPAADVIARDLTGIRYHDPLTPSTSERDPSVPVSWDEVESEVGETSVTLRAPNGLERTCVLHGRYGCVTLPLGVEELDLPYVPAPAREPRTWPLDPNGDVEAAIAPVVADGKGRAIVIAHRGRIVGEAYAPGFSADSRHSGWSMTKSMVGAMVGRLVHEGELTVDAPAPIEAWADDARSSITLDHLLRMSSGLDFPIGMSPWAEGIHYSVYTGLPSVMELAISRPLSAPPGTRCAYANSDPLSAAFIVDQAATRLGIPHVDVPSTLLYDPLGMDSVALNADAAGDFILCGQSMATARDWARFGQLYVDDGVWDDRRLLPEGWLEYVLTPAPADDEPVYGGAFLWLGDRVLPGLPSPCAVAFGHYGQRTIILPEQEVVIVRMGHAEDDELLLGAIARVLDMLA